MPVPQLATLQCHGHVQGRPRGASGRCPTHAICASHVENKCNGLSSNRPDTEGSDGQRTPRAVLDETFNPGHAYYGALARAYNRTFYDGEARSRKPWPDRGSILECAWMPAHRTSRCSAVAAKQHAMRANELLPYFDASKHGELWTSLLLYINGKHHILHNLLHSMKVRDLWCLPAQPASAQAISTRPVCDQTLLDIGAGVGWIGAFVQAVTGTTVVAYEVGGTQQCDSFLSSPFRINFMAMDGAGGSVRVPEPPRSHDGVSFLNVLHHAAEKAPGLLVQACTIARRYVLITEDFCLRPASAHCEMKASVNAHYILCTAYAYPCQQFVCYPGPTLHDHHAHVLAVTGRWLTQAHDPFAIYRNVSEWESLFATACPAFHVWNRGHTPYKRSLYDRYGNLTIALGGTKAMASVSPGTVWFVLRRTGSGGISRAMFDV